MEAYEERPFLSYNMKRLDETNITFYRKTEGESFNMRDFGGVNFNLLSLKFPQ
jgi:hypothetical protein